MNKFTFCVVSPKVMFLTCCKMKEAYIPKCPSSSRNEISRPLSGLDPEI